LGGKKGSGFDGRQMVRGFKSSIEKGSWMEGGEKGK